MFDKVTVLIILQLAHASGITAPVSKEIRLASVYFDEQLRFFASS